MHLFFLIVAVILGLEHLYLYRHLVLHTAPARATRWLGGTMLGLGWLLVINAHLLTFELSGPVAHLLSRVAWAWFGVSIYLFLFLLLGQLGSGGWGGLGWLRRKLGRSSSEPPVETVRSRRRFLARAMAGVSAVAATGVSAFGISEAYEPAQLTELPIRLKGLPRALDGLTLVQITDLHIGDVLGERFLAEVVARCNALKPDLVAITGDLVDASVEVLAPTIATVRKLRSRYGTWFVTGNHEYYAGADEWCDALTRMGVGVLRNRRVSIGDSGGSFDLVGVDDWGARRRGFAQAYDLEAAISGRDRDRAAVLLAHEPSNYRQAIDSGMGLQLSGHTHGGQMFPATWLVDLRWHPSRGRLDYHGGTIYVSRGTGFWGAPMRVGSPPEIVRVSLLAG